MPRHFCDSQVWETAGRVATLLPGRILGLVLLSMQGGCFAIPTPYHPDADFDASGRLPDIRKVVGEGQSSRPLRLDLSTRADVERVLGSPTTRSADSSVYVYTQQMFAGYGVVMPLLYGAAGPLRQRTYFLRLDFDPAGLLRGRRLEHGESSDAAMGYTVMPPDRVPTRLLPTSESGGHDAIRRPSSRAGSDIEPASAPIHSEPTVSPTSRP